MDVKDKAKMESRNALAALVVVFFVFAALALVALASLSSSGGLRDPLADLESALLLPMQRARRSLPPSTVRKTSGAVGALFCGDSILECGVWLNKLFPLR